ncbi:galactosyltransferase-related protein [Streptomyces sp. NPDC050610]|uniref:galactosyltransferase-related protein n=1 Tax=Streptomyces sp. NPDC050610 TaxID=3157097 RepID=UPI003445BB40
MTRMTQGIPAKVAERLADHAALSVDQGARDISATSWELSEPYVAEAVKRLERLAADDARTTAAYARLCGEPMSPAVHAELTAALTALLAPRPEDTAELGAWLDETEQRTDMGYHVGAAYTPDAAPAPLAKVREWGDARTGGRPAPGGHELLVVVPFRDGDAGRRTRNLLSCLLALGDQTLDADRYAVTVVEADDRPRWRDVIAPHANHYVHAPNGGLFNKSWTMNVGVTNTPGDPRYVCMLDADVLLDRDFLERNLERIATGEHAAHLPYHRGGLLALDDHSSDRALLRRLGEGHASPDPRELRGQLLLAAPGASVWADAGLYHRIGGFDERFAGWGGEDDDFVERLSRHGDFVRFDDTVMHLNHPRPVMRVEGRAFNAHVEMGTWDGSEGYGLIDAYAAV